MTSITVTLKERKHLEAQRRQIAAADIASSLFVHAKRLGGRYIIFGSAARGTMRYDSDLDILVDFPLSVEREAIGIAEDLCQERQLPCDVFPMASRSKEFLERALKDARVIE